MAATLHQGRIATERTTRGGVGRQGRDRIRCEPPAGMADNLMRQVRPQTLPGLPGRAARSCPRPIFEDNGFRQAHPPVAVEGRRAALLRSMPVRGPEATWPAGNIRAASSITPTPLSPSPTRHQQRSGLGAGLLGAVSTSCTPRNRYTACLTRSASEPRAKRVEFRFPGLHVPPGPGLLRHAPWPPRWHRQRIEPP